MARSPSGGTASSAGSLSSTAPRSIVAEGAPPNVNERPDAAAIAGPLSRRAMCAAPISSGSLPYWLLNNTRTLDPPMLVRTTCRTVWPAMRGGAPGASSASASGTGSDTGPVAQVPTQRASAGASVAAGGCGAAHETTRAAAASVNNSRPHQSQLCRMLISPPIPAPRSACRAQTRNAAAGSPGTPASRTRRGTPRASQTRR